MSTVDNTRPPYVVFERRPVEDRTASIAAGHYVARDVDYAVITRPGSRDTLDKEALVWLAEIREKCRKGELPSVWYEGFAAAYKAFQEGEDVPVKGTPIKGWPVLSPAAQKSLIGAGILTVEDLAAFSDSELSQIGTGAQAYKQKAAAWLAAAEGPGKVTEKISALTQQIAELVELSRKQAQEISELRAKVPAPAKA